MFASNSKERIYHVYKKIDKKLKKKQAIICNCTIIDPQPKINTLFSKRIFLNKHQLFQSTINNKYNQFTSKIPHLLNHSNKKSIMNQSNSRIKTNMTLNNLEGINHQLSLKQNKSLAYISDRTEKESSISKSVKQNAISDNESDKKENNVFKKVSSSKLLKANLSQKQLNLYNTGLKTRVRRSSIIDRFMFKLINPDSVIEDYYHVYDSKAEDYYAMFKKQLLKTKLKMTKLIDNVQKAASMNESMMKVHIHNIGKEYRGVTRCKTSSKL